MSYTKEQSEKNKLYIESQMAGCDHQDKAELLLTCNKTWPDDEEVKALVAAKKAEIALRATPEEMDEVFKDFRI